MKDGEPIGFVNSEQSPEIAEIGIAIKEADDWILYDREEIDNVQLQIEIGIEMIAYATEYSLTSPNISITDLESRLDKTRQNLQRDLALKEELVKLQLDFHHLDWRRNLLEIEEKHFLQRDNFPKPVD